VNTSNTQSFNTQFPSNAAQVVAPGRVFYWSMRRELWEYRSLYVAPLAVAALFLFGFLISLVHFPSKMRALAMLSPMQQSDRIQEPYHLASALMMGVALIVALFYCIDAMHGERRDRSILFWKSMPVSDRMTVLAKAAIPMVFLQLLAFALSVAMQWIMILASSVVLLVSGGSVATLWGNLPLIQMWWMLLYHLIAVHSLYYAPVYAYLLLVSAWARRAPFLWAGLPLLAIAVAEKIAFNSWHFASFLQSRVVGSGNDAGDVTAPVYSMVHSPSVLILIEYLVSPGLWIGLAFAAAFLAGAIWLRRSQGPI
jgi:ABC-2 type transport system permease protein